jgi:hypothetical protein
MNAPRPFHRVFSLIAAVVSIAVVVAAFTIVFRDAPNDPAQARTVSATPTTNAGSSVSSPPSTATTAPTPTMPLPTPVPVARFHSSLVSNVPEGYLLRTEGEAWRWATELVGRYPESATDVISVALMTRYDQLIADVAAGSHSPYRDPDDTPIWRMEFGGAPLPGVHLHCGPYGSGGCLGTGRTIIWVRAVDGSYDGYQFRPDDTPAIVDLATAVPAPKFDLPVDPAEPLLAGAEVVHIVSVSEGDLRFVQSEVEADTPITTETWLNRSTGEAVIRETRASGKLESLTILRGTTLDRYLAESYNSLTDTPRYTHLRTEALSVNDPAIHLPIAYLDWYRDALARGHARLIAYDEYDGQPALKVLVAAGTDAQHIAYLDPTYLLPLAVIITESSDPEPAEQVEEYRYLTIESFTADAIPAGAFDTSPPAAGDAPREITSRQLTFDDARAFDAYALWSPGASLDDYNLVSVEHDTDAGDDSAHEDLVRFVYQRGDDRDDRIVITCYGVMMDYVRGDYVQQRINGSEEIATPTGPAWLWTDSNLNDARVNLDREDTLILIRAPDRATAIATANALHRINDD